MHPSPWEGKPSQAFCPILASFVNGGEAFTGFSSSSCTSLTGGEAFTSFFSSSCIRCHWRGSLRKLLVRFSIRWRGSLHRLLVQFKHSLSLEGKPSQASRPVHAPVSLEGKPSQASSPVHAFVVTGGEAFAGFSSGSRSVGGEAFTGFSSSSSIRCRWRGGLRRLLVQFMHPSPLEGKPSQAFCPIHAFVVTGGEAFAGFSSSSCIRRHWRGSLRRLSVRFLHLSLLDRKPSEASRVRAHPGPRVMGAHFFFCWIHKLFLDSNRSFMESLLPRVSSRRSNGGLLLRVLSAE